MRPRVLSSPPDVRLVTAPIQLALVLLVDEPQAEALLWRRQLALHHLQLLSPSTAPRDGEPPRLVSHGARAGTAPLPIRCRWIRGHARTRPPADWRTANQEPFHGDAGPQTRIR